MGHLEEAGGSRRVDLRGHRATGRRALYRQASATEDEEVEVELARPPASSRPATGGGLQPLQRGEERERAGLAIRVGWDVERDRRIPELRLVRQPDRLGGVEPGDAADPDPGQRRNRAHRRRQCACRVAQVRAQADVGADGPRSATPAGRLLATASRPRSPLRSDSHPLAPSVARLASMPVDVIILHPLPGSDAGPLERALVAARATLAERHRRGFLAAGAAEATVVAGGPDGRPFGVRLRALVAGRPAGRGIVLLGSGALPLATAADRRALVTAAAADGCGALVNNRYSADVLALSAAAAGLLADVPADLPGDNALPRWLDEVAGVAVTDLKGHPRLGMDLDSPLDLVLLAAAAAGPPELRAVGSELALTGLIGAALDRVGRVLSDRRAELVVAGRTSARTLAWLERHARCRVRAIVEERGLRAASRLAQGADDDAAGLAGADRARGRADRGSSSAARSVRPVRPPVSLLGMILDRDGPAALGARLAELADAALVDSRVLLAHRLGADEVGWPTAEDRFASDLLRSDPIADPWLRALTAGVAAAPIPILLGGHSLVGPGVRLLPCGGSGRSG